jgi:magnesium chelatase family protein
MAHVAGQFLAKRALVIAAAGQHNVRLFGPPGSGKTLLVQAMAGLLPDLSLSEVLELTTIYSIAGQLPQGVVAARPVRSPHHTSSMPALIGGGGFPRPGEITLAHRGILFLDELPEFSRSVLETLRQPLESGSVTITRAKTAVTFPAQFTLVAAQNPCPCGFYGDSTTRCSCSPGMLYRYQTKVSGPLLDRFDLHVLVARLPYRELTQHAQGLRSADYKALVVAARAKQTARFGSTKTNAEMTSSEVQQYCQLDSVTHVMLEKVADSYDLSARGVHRLLKVARTIADLADAEHISSEHIMEAVQYRLAKPGV